MRTPKVLSLSLLVVAALAGCSKKKKADAPPAPTGGNPAGSGATGGTGGGTGGTNSGGGSTGGTNSGAGGTATPTASTQTGCIKELKPDSLPQGDIILKKDCGPVTVDGDITIDATLTIEPGVQVMFKEDADLGIGYNNKGRLVAKGSKDAPIIFTTAGEKTPGIWGGIRLYNNANRSDIEWATIQYAGSNKHNSDHPASLEVGDTDKITLKNVTFQDGKGHGLVALHNEPSFDSEVSGCEFKGLEKGAMNVHPAQLAKLAADNKMDDKAVVETTEGEIRENTTLHAGTTYRMMGNLGVERAADNAGIPTLTVEAGATIEGTSEKYLYVGYGNTGTLKAVGTADKPIKFTSFDKKKGTWAGIHLYDKTRDTDLENISLEFASSSDDDGAIKIDQGAEATLKNVALAHLDGVGVSAPKDPKVKLEGLKGDDVKTVQKLSGE